MLIHFTSERGKPLYNSKNDPEMAGPKASIIIRFHCTMLCRYKKFYVFTWWWLGLKPADYPHNNFHVEATFIQHLDSW